ncbi:MAG: hypothetical protein OEV24_15035 [Cyclobacteriaceae bacterium]|nr:hypothetical protein [Cyclobacteriaceae bacterium]
MNSNELFSWEKVKQSFNKRWMPNIVYVFFLFTGCLSEEVMTNLPKTGLEQIQLHDFNAPLNGGSLEGTAPDIYYFRQKEDGSYVFTLSYDANYGGFETNWQTDYVVVNADASGIVQKTKTVKFPVKDGFIGNFAHVFDAGIPPDDSPLASTSGFFLTSAVGPNYVSDDNGILYFTPDQNCLCRNLFFNLHPETGQAEYFSANGGERPLSQTFRTLDEGFITIGGVAAPDFHKFTENGTLEFKQPMKYWEKRPAFVYLSDRNGNNYFITTYNGPPHYAWTYENTAKSFYYIRYTEFFLPPIINIEMRFGPGKGQKAHRFNRHFNFQPGPGWEYQDYVDVPFEVWDVTHNQQLMASFRDQGEDGAFDLVPWNIDWGGFPIFPGPFNDDPNQSQEWIVGNTIPYSPIPDENIIAQGPLIAPGFVMMGYLTDGATWNPAALPSSYVSMKIDEPIPGTQILEVNANGSAVLKDNFVLGTLPLQNMYKAVPYQDGSAVLINVAFTNAVFAPLNVVNPKTQLAILDGDFNQTAVLNMVASSADKEHQLEYSREKDKVFYARMTSNPAVNTENAFKGSLLLTVIKDNSIKSEKYLDEFIPFKLEKYRMTPTNSGGVAIVAWVRPTKDTRDLLFIELDENLELVNR